MSAASWAASAARGAANATQMATIITMRKTIDTWDLHWVAGFMWLPEEQQADDARVCRVGAVDVSEHEGAWLHDAVDDTRVEREVEDPERFVGVRPRERHAAGETMANIDSELLQFVERLGQLGGWRQRAARHQPVHVVGRRVRIVVGQAGLGIAGEARWHGIDGEVVNPLGRIGGPVAQRVLGLYARTCRTRALQSRVSLVVVAAPAAEAIGLLIVDA